MINERENYRRKLTPPQGKINCAYSLEGKGGGEERGKTVQSGEIALGSSHVENSTFRPHCKHGRTN